MSLPKSCEKCSAPNILDANWCTACGSAFVSCKDLVNRAVVHDGEETTAVGVPTHDPFLHCGDSNLSPTFVEHELNSSPKRHWEGSKYYMWRKPRSNVESSVEYSIEEQSSDESVEHSNVEPSTDKSVEHGNVEPSTDKSLEHVLNTVDFKEEEPCNILNCPIEVMILIFSFLRQCDLFHCMQVCRTFHDLANYKIFWRAITLRKINVNRNILQQVQYKTPLSLKMVDCKGSLNTYDVVEFVQKSENLQSLTLELCTLGEYMCDALLQSAAKYCKHLISISIDWILVSKETIMKMIQSCRHLEELSIKHPEISSSALQILFLLHHNRLRSLNVESTFITKILAAIRDEQLPITSMKSFASLFNEIDGGIMRRLAHTFPELDSLHIHCQSNSKVLQLQEAVKELLNIPLRAIYFRHFKSDVFYLESYSMLSQMSSLRYLGINCLNDEELKILCGGILHLKLLDISGSLVSDCCFAIILSGSFSSSLQCLMINNCDGINTAAVHRTVRSFSSKNWRGTTVAEEIGFFIHSCNRLQTIEVRGIQCAPEIDSPRTCEVLF